MDVQKRADRTSRWIEDFVMKSWLLITLVFFVVLGGHLYFEGLRWLVATPVALFLLGGASLYGFVMIMIGQPNIGIDKIEKLIERRHDQEMDAIRTLYTELRQKLDVVESAVEDIKIKNLG